LQGFTNGVVDRRTNLLLGLLWIYIFVVMLYETRSIYKHHHDVDAPTAIFWVRRLQYLQQHHFECANSIVVASCLV